VTLPAPSAPTVAAPYGLRDLTSLAPTGYRKRSRALSEIRAVVLHQMGVGTWREENPMFVRVRGHFVIHASGLISQNHPITARLRYGSGAANPYAITVEFAGNYPLAYRDNGTPVYWRPNTYGRSVLADHPEQVEAGRALVAHLRDQVPGLVVGCHRQIEAKKSGCCGPDVWREVGQYAIDVLGMPEMRPLDSGLPIDDRWRVPPPPNPT
jgi:hypothetical protein